nr:hypothetical protein [Tanacetum cinerariifolium]
LLHRQVHAGQNALLHGNEARRNFQPEEVLDFVHLRAQLVAVGERDDSPLSQKTHAAQARLLPPETGDEAWGAKATQTLGDEPQSWLNLGLVEPPSGE